MPINPNLLRIAVMKQAEKTLVKDVRPLVKMDFEEKKKEFMEAFDEDAVTQELEGGPDAFSNVPELSEAGGNLFTFLGFLRSQHPAAGLREYLRDNIVLYQTKAGKVSGNKIVFQTKFISPTESEINSTVASMDSTKMHWGSSRSFTDMLAKGVPGLPRFFTGTFPSPKPSRSGGGLQSTNDLNKGTTEKTPKIPYIKRLLRVLDGLMAGKQ